MSGSPESGSSSGGGGEEEEDADNDEPEEALPETTLPPLSTASRGYRAPGDSPASTTDAGAIVPTVFEGIFVRKKKRERGRKLPLSLPSGSRSKERSETQKPLPALAPSLFTSSASERRRRLLYLSAATLFQLKTSFSGFDELPTSQAGTTILSLK